MKSFQARPGSLAADVVIFLQDNPGPQPTEAICRAVDGVEKTSLRQVLANCIAHGLVIVEKDENGWNQYRAPMSVEAELPVDPAPADIPAPRAGPGWAPLGHVLTVDGPRFAINRDKSVTIRDKGMTTTLAPDVARAFIEWVVELNDAARAADEQQEAA